jgi:cell division protein FtsB/cell division protein DivIC
VAKSRQTVAARPDAATRGRTRRIVHGLLLFVACAIVVDAIVGERGLLAMRSARRKYQALEARIAERRAENAALIERARRLRDDDRAIEELARRELGLIRAGERVFIIRDSRN